MKKNILSLAALLIASATFVACSSDDNIIGENQQPANPTGKYTMTINAQKGGDGATTRALTLDGNKLNATWATTENIYVKKAGSWATGSLQPDADAATATLKGTLSGITIEDGNVLTLQFPRSGALDYTGQMGTLADIAANFDYATATVTVASVSASGNIVPTEATTTFTNQQAIVKFTLIDKADGTTSLSASELTVSDGTNDYTVTPASATDEIYVAIPGFSEKTVTLTATVGDDTYTYEKAGVTFANGQYYEITVKMTKQAAGAVAYTECPDGNHPHWINLGLSSGTLWQCCNEGATAPEGYGSYYEFDDAQSYNPPSKDQIDELLDNTTSEWTTLNDVNGRWFTGSNGGKVFLPAAGDRWYGALYDAGSSGYYWSSTLDESNPDRAYYLCFNSQSARWGDYGGRDGGLSVRPVRKN